MPQEILFQVVPEPAYFQMAGWLFACDHGQEAAGGRGGAARDLARVGSDVVRREERGAGRRRCGAAGGEGKRSSEEGDKSRSVHGLFFLPAVPVGGSPAHTHEAFQPGSAREGPRRAAIRVSVAAAAAGPWIDRRQFVAALWFAFETARGR
jgi:hypothetical protein